MMKSPSERRMPRLLGARGIGLAAASMAVLNATDAKMSELQHAPALKAKEMQHTFNKRCAGHLDQHELDAEQRQSAEDLARECQRAGFNYGLDAAIEYVKGVLQDEDQIIARLRAQKPTEHIRKEIVRRLERRDLMWGTSLQLADKKFKDVLP